MALSWKTVLISVAVAAVSALVTAVSPYAASSLYAGAIVAVGGIVISALDSIGAAAQTQVNTNLPPASATPPNLSWAAFQALSGTMVTGAPLSVVATSSNPTTGVIWYAVIDNTNHIVLSIYS